VNFCDVKPGQKVAVYVEIPDRPELTLDTTGVVERTVPDDALGDIIIVTNDRDGGTISCYAQDVTLLPEIKTDFGENGPQPGTAAYTAFIMAQLYPPGADGLPDDYWDTFKEELKGGMI
jgi:hypothetical protein